MVLTGNFRYWVVKRTGTHNSYSGEVMNARAAESAGLVARVVPDFEVLSTAIASAEKISTYSSPVVMMAKEAVQAGKLSLISFIWRL